jgi:hypothetical protein
MQIKAINLLGVSGKNGVLTLKIAPVFKLMPNLTAIYLGRPNFYPTYAAEQKLAPLVREIGWSHNVLIIGRCRDS